jgi:choline-sulfatase
MTQEPPNILLLMSDQHTQKVSGCYGDHNVQTPHLDRLAARGVRFDNAYCPSPICTPSRMSLLTGRWPSTQACWTNSDMLASDIPTYLHGLGAAGYAPALVGRLHSIGPDQLHGYVAREVGDHSSNWVGAVTHDMGPLNRTNEPFRTSLERAGKGQSSYELHDCDVADAARAWLERHAAARARGAARPFALGVGFMLPHQPYVARAEDYARYVGRVGMPTLPRPPAEEDHPYLQHWRSITELDAVSGEDVLRARIAYYALTSRLDALIGQVLQTLESTGLARNTLVIYTSDHGDQLGERGLWWKQTFFDESAKVPLILSWPGVLPQGERRRQVVNLVDLPPTLMEAVQGPALPSIDGSSLLSVARDAAAPWVDLTFSEYCTDGSARWDKGNAVVQRMVRAGDWKLIYYHGYRPQLFNLALDPHELRDLAQDPACHAICEQLLRLVLANWDPARIAEVLTRRRAEKALRGRWWRATRPPEAHRWELKVEDNWLDEPIPDRDASITGTGNN